MKYNIHVTQAAERDMANAYDYIDLVLKNPTAADKLLDVAEEKIGALVEFPHKFEVVSDKLLSLWGIRFTIVMNYLAFYTVDDATLIDVCYENMSYDRQVDFWRHVLETNSLVCEVKE